MKNEIRTFTYSEGEIQNVQMVILNNWSELKFLKPQYNRNSFDNLCDLYCDYIVRKFAFAFGTIVLFRLDDDTEIPFENEDERYGTLYGPLTVVKIAFMKNIRLKNRKLSFNDEKTKVFLNFCKEKEICGSRRVTVLRWCFCRSEIILDFCPKVKRRLC